MYGRGLDRLQRYGYDAITYSTYLKRSVKCARFSALCFSQLNVINLAQCDSGLELDFGLFLVTNPEAKPETDRNAGGKRGGMRKSHVRYSSWG